MMHLSNVQRNSAPAATRFIFGAMALFAISSLVLADESMADAKGHYANVNGLKIYYEMHGQSDGLTPPLVLLHGGGSTITTSFGSMLTNLSKKRQIIAIEQQGNGHTADIEGRPFTFEQSADDTVALLQQLKIEKADFFGYSNGGNVALQIAIRHPAFVRKLVLASTMYRRDGVYPIFWEFMKNATLENMPKELQDAYLKVAPTPGNLQSMHDKSRDRMLAFKDIRPEEIHAIHTPTLLMIGDSDIIRPEHAVEMLRLLPHAQLAVLPGIDHMQMVKRVDWQLSMIDTFLDMPMPEMQ